MDQFSRLLVEAKYDFCEGPLTNGSCFADNGLSLNCQLFAHILLEELGFSLPKWLRSAEIYRRSSGGNVWVDKIESHQRLKVGDLFLFSSHRILHIQDPRIYYLHLGVCLNPATQSIAHASRYLPDGKKHPNGGIVYEQSLCDILHSPRYNTLVGIRRPKQ